MLKSSAEYSILIFLFIFLMLFFSLESLVLFVEFKNKLHELLGNSLTISFPIQPVAPVIKQF